MASLVEANTGAATETREQQLLDVASRWDGEPAEGGGAGSGSARPPPAVPAPPPAQRCRRSGPPPLLPFAPTDAYFNGDAEALKALMAPDIVQHAGRAG